MLTRILGIIDPRYNKIAMCVMKQSECIQDNSGFVYAFILFIYFSLCAYFRFPLQVSGDWERRYRQILPPAPVHREEM